MEAGKRNNSMKAPRDLKSSTAAISELNLVQSLLLRLPVELRRKIWRSVFGHSVHICSTVKWQKFVPKSLTRRMGRRMGSRQAVDESVPLRSYVCAATLSDFEYYERSKVHDDNFKLPDGTPRYDMKDKELNHCDCIAEENRAPPPYRAHNYEKKKKDRRIRQEIDLKALRCCQQMYTEGTDALYRDVTFHFGDLGAFQRFLSSVSPSNVARLKAMHISWSETDVLQTGWEFPDIERVPDLPGLRTLHISINFSTIHPALSSRYFSDQLIESLWCVSLLRFQVYDLERVTVVANDPYVTPDPSLRTYYFAKGGKMYLHRWARTVEEKRRVAERLRSELLQPNGKEMAASDKAVQQRRLESEHRWDRRIMPCVLMTEY